MQHTTPPLCQDEPARKRLCRWHMEQLERYSTEELRHLKEQRTFRISLLKLPPILQLKILSYAANPALFEKVRSFYPDWKVYTNRSEPGNSRVTYDEYDSTLKCYLANLQNRLHFKKTAFSYCILKYGR